MPNAVIAHELSATSISPQSGGEHGLPVGMDLVPGDERQRFT
jgi:hypothetical protein